MYTSGELAEGIHKAYRGYLVSIDALNQEARRPNVVAPDLFNPHKLPW